jgi:hypothetical protein
MFVHVIVLRFFFGLGFLCLFCFLSFLCLFSFLSFLGFLSLLLFLFLAFSLCIRSGAHHRKRKKAHDHYQ